jgi:hypothetical protein
VRALPFLFLLLLLLLLTACNRGLSNTAPPRAEPVDLLPPQTSLIALPVEADLDLLERRLNARLPTKVLTVDERRERCLPKAKIKLSCRLVGDVTRGQIRLSGMGESLKLTMPIAGEIEARDILGFIGTNEATGRALVTADIRLALAPDWTPIPKVDIRYRWEEEPGVRLARQRITFTDVADRELAKLIAKLEAEVPALIAEAHPRRHVEAGWQKAHTVVQLNASNPEVWMRVTPRGFGYGGYAIEKRTLRLLLQFAAGSETFVGNRPPDPDPTPLPSLGRLQESLGFRLVIPVVADWAVLEGQLEKALLKLAKKGIPIAGVGRVAPEFGRPTLYATKGGRVAVGLPIEVRGPRGLLNTRGKVWLTGEVSNAPDTQKLIVRDLTVSGTIEGAQGRLLLAVAQAPEVRQAIADELATNFARDFDKLLGKIHGALTDKRLGAFILNARITDTRNGVIEPLGQGAYLVVEAKGDADLRWEPVKAVQAAKPVQLKG